MHLMSMVIYPPPHPPRLRKEDSIHAIEEEIEREKQAADDIVKKMPPEKQARFAEMNAINEELLQVGLKKKKKNN